MSLLAYTTRVERSTDCSLPPTFNKLAIKVGTQEMLVVEMRNIIFCPPNQKWN